jgi:anaerobic selenocysteine-containing dehydrogenase
MTVSVENGQITDMRGDPEDVFSRGHICPKGPAMREVQDDPDRLRQPMRRTQAGWKAISWKEALDETAARLSEVRQRGGRDAVGLYIGNPTAHNHGALLLLQAFVGSLRTRNKFDANSLDGNPKIFACLQMYGEATSVTIPDVDRTDFLLMLGANPAASSGSIMTLGDVRGRLGGIRARGGRIVLLDPRRTESAAWADEHHFLRPGGDAAFLLAFLHVLFAEKLVDERAIAQGTRGLAQLRSLVSRFTPELVEEAVGIPAKALRSLAIAFGRAKKAVIYGRLGTCLNEFGAVASWLVEVINVVTGNFDREGGAMFTTPAIDISVLSRTLGLSRYARWRSRVRDLPELVGLLPSACMAEEMETPGEGQIRAFVTLAGNPVLSSPNGERLAAALSKLDFMVSVDFYLNETSRHAHIILPPRYSLERPHYDIVFQSLAVRNVVKYSETVMPPAPDTREDWEILYELGMRLGGLHLGPKAVDRAARLAWRLGLRISPDRILDLLVRLGPYGDKFVGKGLNLAKIRQAPHGIDLGPLVPSRKKKIHTSSGLVELAPPLLVADVPRVERWLTEQRGSGLVLIGRRHLRTNNSWMHNVHSLTKGPDRATLLLHPTDAERFGLTQGQRARITSRVGTVTMPVETTFDIMPGVVSMPHGYGHAPSRDTQRIAGRLPGASINDLTDDSFVEPLTGTAILNGVPVTVEAA